MHARNFLRLMVVALLVSFIPIASHAAVFVSVGFAPPPLPVYVQPPCPEPGWMWTPGYWAYGPDGYYWVPGTWVPAPYEGALWTPGYWGWGGGLYAWHPGYWGPHVGYYGGVNYGFGYMGVGFAGGLWVGGAFRYNTAVMHVGPGIHNVYVDNTIVHNTTIINDRHVAFSGGPGGINHAPTTEETRYSNEHHIAATSFQEQHRNAAMSDRTSYFNNNHGRPNNAAVARPMAAQSRPMNQGGFNHEPNATPQYHGNQQAQQPHYQPQQHNQPQFQQHNQPQPHYQPQEHQAPQPHNGGHGEQQPHDSHDRGH